MHAWTHLFNFALVNNTFPSAIDVAESEEARADETKANLNQTQRLSSAESSTEGFSPGKSYHGPKASFADMQSFVYPSMENVAGKFFSRAQTELVE